MIACDAEMQPHPFGHPATMEALLQAAALEESAALAWEHAAVLWQRHAALLCKAGNAGGERQGEKPVVEVADTPSATRAKAEQKHDEKQEQDAELPDLDGPEEEPPS